MYIVQREPYPLHAETQLLKYQLINREKNSHCAPYYLYNNLKELWLGPNGKEQFRIEKDICLNKSMICGFWGTTTVQTA